MLNTLRVLFSKDLHVSKIVMVKAGDTKGKPIEYEKAKEHEWVGPDEKRKRKFEYVEATDLSKDRTGWRGSVIRDIYFRCKRY